MEIVHGAEVIDKNGKRLGTVDRVIRDTYTTEIRKFTVSTDITDADLFFSPEEVQESTTKTVKLRIALDEGESLEVKFGAEVVDKDDKLLGTVDYPVRDTLTGEIRSFKVNTPHTDTDLFFSTEDLLEVSPARVKLKFSFDEIGQMK
jgi:sporulation protein YlmC with PRC-barrel domain